MKPDKGNNKRNTFGLITLILWALVLTMVFKSCSSSYASANEVQVDYSTFKQWVTEDKVERVLMQSNKYTITLREGATVDVPEQKDSDNAMSFPWLTQQNQETVYVTTPTPESDSGIYELMDAHNTQYYDEPVDSSSYILSLLLSYLLPIVIMVGAMMFLFRGIGGKGGMGGLGGVGKANAKVYVEKKTGVTFRDVAGYD
ncbi:MAG: ATP-dependent metallopeptidase FtsH/Yme1/Tma family protein, partial [Lawsonibacter sp.]